MMITKTLDDDYKNTSSLILNTKSTVVIPSVLEYYADYNNYWF